MRLIVYNPDHDEALAVHIAAYTPSKAAQAQINYWADRTLPWQKEGDIRWDEHKAVEWEKITEIVPFGWDLAIRHRLRRKGAPEHLLPTDSEIEQIRLLSSRLSTVRLLERIRPLLPSSYGEARWATSMEEVENITKEWGEVVIKAPWSCAGRGVFRFHLSSEGNSRQRISKLLRTQGAVEIEPFYEGGHDFALEWDYRNGEAQLLGINVFHTSEGRFLGNLSLDDFHLPLERLRPIIEVIRKVLPDILKNDYNGPLGIDMMYDEKERIHPCIEINLRHTMSNYTPITL